MVRTACIDLPALPLQLLLRRNPEWRDRPVAVVDRDHPQGVLLWVNESARHRRVLPGLRYAAARSLCRDLRAAEVPERAIRQAVRGLTARLRKFSPSVEPADEEPGVFWLDAKGLEPLFESLRDWARRIREDLLGLGFHATVVAGFDRFASYANARAKRGVVVFRTPEEENASARRVPLDRLSCPANVRDELDKLGIRTVGAFADLPVEGIEKRFGKETGRLHRMAGGALHIPLQPEHPPPPATRRLLLDHPETAVPRLLAIIERLLPPLLATLAERNELLAEIHVGFRFDRSGDHLERVRPAAATLDARQLTELIRLRLEAVRRLPDGVTEVILAGRGVRIRAGQRNLFADRSRRDPRAAERALARIRAGLGESSVRRARLRAGHLPEGSYTWDRLDSLPRPIPRSVGPGTLVRRIYDPPRPLPSRQKHEPDGWLLRDLAQGPVIRMLGPYVVSGGWWNRSVHREYHFAETRSGDTFWIFYDRRRRRWFLHGRVE